MAGAMRGYDYDVKGLRQRLGLTQQELATRLDVSISTVARWEGGGKVSRLALRRLEALAQQAEGKSEKGKEAA